MKNWDDLTQQEQEFEIRNQTSAQLREIYGNSEDYFQNLRL